jgi:hypothetical protein
VACIEDKCYVLTFNEYCRYATYFMLRFHFNFVYSILYSVYYFLIIIISAKR